MFWNRMSNFLFNFDVIVSFHRKQTVMQSLGENFRRIFVERGVDFFDKLKAGEITDDEDIASTQAGSPSREPENVEDTSTNDNPMSTEEVAQLRQDMQMQLQ